MLPTSSPSIPSTRMDRRIISRRRIASRLRRELRLARRTVQVPSIVGFYRSHTRPDFAITAEDASLFSTYFRNPSDVFLLIKSNDEGPPTGGFIIREEGQILSESPYAQFPLDWKIGIRSTREAPVPDFPTPQAPRPAARIHSFPVRPHINYMVARPVRLAAAAGAALAVAMTVGLSVGILRHAPAPIAAASALPLALSVATSGDSLRLSWDHKAFSHAGTAVLWIKDGEEEQRFALDAKQLSEAVWYWPTNRDVTFRLELISSGGAKVTESVRSIGGPSHLPVPTSSGPSGGSSRRPFRRKRSSAPPAEVRPAKHPRTNRIGTASRLSSRTFAMARPESMMLADAAPAPLPEPPPTIRQSYRRWNTVTSFSNHSCHAMSRIRLTGSVWSRSGPAGTPGQEHSFDREALPACGLRAACRRFATRDLRVLRIAMLHGMSTST